MDDLGADASDLTTEGSAAVLTTFGSPAEPLSDYVLNLETVDNTADGDIGRDNNATTDTITYETSPGGPTQTSTLDTIIRVEANVRFASGFGG